MEKPYRCSPNALTCLLRIGTWTTCILIFNNNTASRWANRKRDKEQAKPKQKKMRYADHKIRNQKVNHNLYETYLSCHSVGIYFLVLWLRFVSFWIDEKREKVSSLYPKPIGKHTRKKIKTFQWNYGDGFNCFHESGHTDVYSCVKNRLALRKNICQIKRGKAAK